MKNLIAFISTFCYCTFFWNQAIKKLHYKSKHEFHFVNLTLNGFIKI